MDGAEWSSRVGWWRALIQFDPHCLARFASSPLPAAWHDSNPPSLWYYAVSRTLTASTDVRDADSSISPLNPIAGSGS